MTQELKNSISTCKCGALTIGLYRTCRQCSFVCYYFKGSSRIIKKIKNSIKKKFNIDPIDEIFFEVENGRVIHTSELLYRANNRFNEIKAKTSDPKNWKYVSKASDMNSRSNILAKIIYDPGHAFDSLTDFILNEPDEVDRDDTGRD